MSCRINTDLLLKMNKPVIIWFLSCLLFRTAPVRIPFFLILVLVGCSTPKPPNYSATQSTVVVCSDYKPGPAPIVSMNVLMEVKEALDDYNFNFVNEALEILQNIHPKNEYDKAFVDNFIGKILATHKATSQDALSNLKSSVKVKVLVDTEHASTLKLIGDLSMREKEYEQAIQYYQNWMIFTCKEDPDIYTRMSLAYYKLEKLPEMIEPINNAIALYEKPNKNPYDLKLQSYYDRKMYKETVEVGEELVRIFPDDGKWLSELGFFYMLLEDYAKALSTFETAYRKGYLSKKSATKTLNILGARLAEVDLQVIDSSSPVETEKMPQIRDFLTSAIQIDLERKGDQEGSNKEDQNFSIYGEWSTTCGEGSGAYGTFVIFGQDRYFRYRSQADDLSNEDKFGDMAAVVIEHDRIILPIGLGNHVFLIVDNTSLKHEANGDIFGKCILEKDDFMRR